MRRDPVRLAEERIRPEIVERPPGLVQPPGRLVLSPRCGEAAAGSQRSLAPLQRVSVLRPPLRSLRIERTRLLSPPTRLGQDGATGQYGVPVTGGGVPAGRQQALAQGDGAGRHAYAERLGEVTGPEDRPIPRDFIELLDAPDSRGPVTARVLDEGGDGDRGHE